MRKKSNKRTNARRASAREFAAFMEANGLRNNAGADLVASWLYGKRSTVFAFYHRGILRTELELLQIKLEKQKARDLHDQGPSTSEEGRE